MGLLRHLWDDTIAGPPPESGLGEFHGSSSSSSPATKATAKATAVAGGGGGGIQITRNITILRPSTSPSSSAASSPRCPSPAACADTSLAPPTPRNHWRSLRRKEVSPAAEGMESVEPRSPTVYDWFITAISNSYTTSHQ